MPRRVKSLAQSKMILSSRPRQRRKSMSKEALLNLTTDRALKRLTVISSFARKSSCPRMPLMLRKSERSGIRLSAKRRRRSDSKLKLRPTPSFALSKTSYGLKRKRSCK